MNKPRIVAAIDIGSSKVATLVGQVSSDPTTGVTSINIIGSSQSESRGVKWDKINDIDEAVESIIQSIEGAERMAGYNLDTAYVSVGGPHIHSQNSHGVVAVTDPEGEINENDIDRVIEAASAITLPASREVIFVVPREFIIDGEPGVKDAIGMSGIRLEVDTHIVSAASAPLKDIKKAVNETGVKIEEVVFSGLASAESVLTPTEKELGCVLIDIGGGTTSVAAYVNGAVSYSGVIPIGAKNVTNDLAIGLRVSLETAEKIKLALSENKKKEGEDTDELDLARLNITEIKKISKKTITEGIIRPRLNEIFSIVKIELEKEGIVNRIPAGAIITGGGSETVGVVDSAKRTLSVPVRLGLPKGVGGLIDDVITPSFSTCVGLILYGAKSKPVENLTSFAKKMKLPSVGMFGKLIDSIKNLLP